MTQEPTEAPVPNLGGFGKQDAGSAFARRMQEMSKQNSGGSSAAAPEQAKPTSSAPPDAAVVRAPVVETAPAGPPPSLRAPSAPPAPGGTAARHVKPTVLSVEESIVRRFESARKDAPSHTGLILQALEAHYQELPQLIVDRRPKPAEGALFSFRPTPGEVVSERRLPIRIRPLAAELRVIDDLVDQCKQAVDSEVNRSEMVAAALDAHLPELPKKRRRSTR